MAQTLNTDNYVLGRGISESIRLDAQHLLWKLHNGYVLHPDITITDGMKIAELGTGTGMWLTDLAETLPASVQLDGFDISSHQFPPKEQWPDNLDLGVMDAFVDPPLARQGQYDVVHLRMWASNLREAHIKPLIRHISLLLKPGGYIQWDEADLVNQVVKGNKAKAFEDQMNSLFPHFGLDYSWASRLPTYFDEEGFDIVSSKTGKFNANLAQLGTNTYLMAIQEILNGMKKVSDASSLPLVMSREKALHGLMGEANRGMVYNWSPVTMLAQKPY